MCPVVKEKPDRQHDEGSSVRVTRLPRAWGLTALFCFIFLSQMVGNNNKKSCYYVRIQCENQCQGNIWEGKRGKMLFPLGFRAR